MLSAARPLALAAAFAAAACSSETPSEASGEPQADGGLLPGDACAELAPTCFENQQICSMTSGRARCEPCPEGHYADPRTEACEPLLGTLWTNEFAEFSVGPGEEVLGLCQSWTLDNPEEIWVSAVEMRQNEQSHHSNWMFVPDDAFDGPDGVWPCAEREYHQLEAALQGGVLYAQSTQATREVQKFPDGVAVRIPPYSRIIGDVHLLNVTTESVTGNISLSIYQIPRSEVSVKLAPFHLTYNGLAIPPQTRSRFMGECSIDPYSRELLGRPLDVQVYFILPHTHALGSRYFLEVFGGPNDGASIIDIEGFNSEPRGRFYTPPIDMTGADGFRFGCEFDNPRSEVVGWGFGDQEMCENLGFIAGDIAFESRVRTAEPAGVDGDIPVFTGECETLAIPYDHEKGGGPPR
jgi:hypothetical protein